MRVPLFGTISFGAAGAAAAASARLAWMIRLIAICWKMVSTFDTIQYTSSLAPGVRKRIEYPVDGFQVTAVRTVRDRDGNVIHRDTYYSNYARITGIVLVGKGAPKPESTGESPAPTPAP